MTKKWLGNKTCDICGEQVSSKGVSCFDAPTFMGPWAFMCKPCWLQMGLSGGQEYDAKTLLKIRDLGRK